MWTLKWVSIPIENTIVILVDIALDATFFYSIVILAILNFLIH